LAAIFFLAALLALAAAAGAEASAAFHRVSGPDPSAASTVVPLLAPASAVRSGRCHPDWTPRSTSQAPTADNYHYLQQKAWRATDNPLPGAG